MFAGIDPPAPKMAIEHFTRAGRLRLTVDVAAGSVGAAGLSHPGR